MRIRELRELSFQPYMPPVYPTFFLMRLSVASVVFVSGASKKVGEWVEQGFSKKKYYPQGWRFFLKTIEHPNPGFTFAPRTGTIHLLRLSERPSKMEVNGCGGILDMNVQGKERKEMSKKRCGENVKSANIPRKYVATVWLNLFSYAVAIFFPVCRHG